MCSVASVEVAQVRAPDLARHLHLVRLESAGDAGFHHRRARDLWPPNGGVVFFYEARLKNDLNVVFSGVHYFSGVFLQMSAEKGVKNCAQKINGLLCAVT